MRLLAAESIGRPTPRRGRARELAHPGAIYPPPPLVCPERATRSCCDGAKGYRTLERPLDNGSGSPRPKGRS